MRLLTARLDPVCVLGALLVATVLMATGSRDVFWTGDFFGEVFHPAYLPLMRGDWNAFSHHLPGYASFTVLVGAPAALAADALGGAETMVFRLTALPGLLLLAGLGAVLASSARRAGRRGWPLVLVLGAGGPLAYQTLHYGHPEDLLAGAAAVLAVLAARDGRTGVATVLLVVAVAAKQWAVLAIAPAALAAPRGGLRIALVGGAGSAVVIGAQMFLVPVAAGALTSTGGLFHPHQVWWPLGIPAPAEFTAAGHGVRTAPGWLQLVTRPLIIGGGVALAALWWVRAGAERNRDDALALLALVLLLRCALDPWNLVYYHLPCALALVAWETRRGRPYPVIALACSAAAWLSFVTYAERETNGPFLLYMSWAVPLAMALAVAVFGRPATGRAPAASLQAA